MLDPFHAAARAVAGLLDQLFAAAPSYGLAIVLLTFLVHAAVFPLSLRAVRSRAVSARLAPQLDAIRRRNAEDGVAAMRESRALLRANGGSLIPGCLPNLLQAPVFLMLYQVVFGLTRSGAGGIPDPRFLAAGSAIRDSLVRDGGAMPWLGMDLSRSLGDVAGLGLVALPHVGVVLAVVATSICAARVMARSGPTATDASAGAALAKSFARVMPYGAGLFAAAVPAAVGVYLLAANLARLFVHLAADRMA